MATSQTDIKAQTIDLSAEAFDTFCQDISGMFGVEMSCSQCEPCTETVKGLNKRFKRLAAVNSIKSEGVLDGNFRIVFDKEGLFTLAGVIVMLPEQRILANAKNGITKNAQDMGDAVGEAGNLLIGSWDRIFREGLETHGHFMQTGTFVGNPWDNPEETVGMTENDEFLFVPYKMTIDPYPTFNCGVIFPEKIFGETPVSEADTTPPENEKKQEEIKQPQDTTEKPAEAEKVEAEKPEEKPAEPEKVEAVKPAEKPAEPEEKPAEAEKPAEPTEKPVEAEEKPAEKPVEAEEKPAEKPVEAEEKPAEPTEKPAEAETNSEQPETTNTDNETEPPTGSVSETIQKIAQSSADLPGGENLKALDLSAKDIMQNDVLWGNADDSVQQALTKMQQADAGYLMVGTDGSLEGIVSTFDIAAALSVYLRPMFEKWHRPIDDATLQIKIKWIMTRPVHTIKPDTSLMAIMENMHQSGLRCLPVVDQQGNVTGLVTAFDVFKALLSTNSDISTAGKTLQAPSLI